MAPVHLIAGLGNPGAEYACTRHNAGFLLADRLAARWGAAWRGSRKLRAEIAKARYGPNQVVLCKPQTFMNASGVAVKAAVEYFNVPLERLVVVVDDADLAVGQLRLRPHGSSGGHHGLESVIAHLGTSQFPRLRIGIGRSQGAREITDYVLGKFTPDEAVVLDKVLTAACEQLECWLESGISKAMSKFNGWVVKATELETKPQSKLVT
ncbi:MAG: aminoacyl-tRNA hydrolase [Verrucomicrobiae bacterium]|nr:aminoacyl-tRNA hydrolase [Verrucomicrobiae bacterium]MDW7980430.1 aminoacyl-tRNA hydrolase [Verrucomicrobiales bacterium]